MAVLKHKRFPIAILGLIGCYSAGLATTHATTILIDFATALAGNGPGGIWNEYGTTAAINGSTVVDSLGLATPVTFNKSGNLTVSTNAGVSLTYDNTAAVGNPAWVATPTNNLAAGDLFYTDNGSGGPGGIGQVVFTFGGLTPGNLFSLDILGSRNTDVADGFYEFSLDGGTNYFGFNVLNPDGSAATANNWSTKNTQTQAFDNLRDGYQAHRYMNVSSIALTGTTLLVRARDVDATSGNFAALNALQLTIVPEPSTAAVLAGGIGVLLAWRRRRG